MDTALVVTGIAGVAFCVSHLGLSSRQARGRLVDFLGEKGFLGFYTLVALLTLAAMIVAYAKAAHTVQLWWLGLGARHLPLLVMPVALTLIAGGIIAPNPSVTGMENALDRPDPARGVLCITRHPMMWGIALWAAVHLLVNGDLASLLFFGSFLLTAVLGSLHLDDRMRIAHGERWQRFAAVTSYLPFAAILRGRQTLVWSELRRPVGWGVGLFALLLLLHPYLFGVRPY